MFKPFNAVLLGAVAVLLASCAGGKQTSSQEDELDGRSFSAKPNMARLYIIHGATKNTDPVDQSVYVMGSPLRVAILAAAATAHTAIEQANPPPPSAYDPTDPENRHPHFDDGVREDYYINNQKVGTIEAKQYMALDLVPGHYTVKAVSVNVSKREVLDNTSVDLAAGQVIYLYSSVSVGASYHDSQLARCDEKCQSLIASDHRIIAH